MKLVNNFQFDIKEFYGDIVLVYLEGGADTIASVRERLDMAGYSYHACPIGATDIFGRDNVDRIISRLDKCTCFIPVITSELMKSTNSLFRSVFWYLIGYMKASSPESTVPYIPEGDNGSLLSGTPIQSLDFVSSPDALFRTLVNRYSSRLLRNDYYDNSVINTYASRRIVYHCLRLRFDIYEEAFQNARELYVDYTSRNMNDSAFDSYIENRIVCGCKVVSFGNPDGLTPQMAVYRDEVTPKILDYTPTRASKKYYRKNTPERVAETGIRAELGVDVVIPVHKLLGAYIKCYFESDDADSDVNVLLSLMEGDFVGKCSECDLDLLDDEEYWKSSYPVGTHINKKQGRFYFVIGMQRTNDELIPDASLDIGDSMDFVFPQ